MRNIFCLALLLAVLRPAAAQTRQDSLDLARDVDSYMRISMKIDYDSLLYFMPPAMFDMVPKDVLNAQLRSAFENDVVKITLEDFVVKPPFVVGKAGEHLYSTVGYEGSMTMRLLGEPDSTASGMVYLAMGMQFGMDNVQKRPDGTLHIRMPGKRMIAIKSPGFDSWKFIEDKRKSTAPGDEATQDLVNEVLPAEVLEATKQ
jgi:hypothetical protein